MNDVKHIDDEVKHEMVLFCIQMIKDHNKLGHTEMVEHYAEMVGKYYDALNVKELV